MITKSESHLGASMAKAFVVLIIISFGIQAFLIPSDQVGYSETWGPALSLINFVLSFAFLFVIYIGTKLFGGEENIYVNVTGTMAFVAQVVNTMPAFGALGHSNSINENFLTVNQVVDATSAATSAWGVFIGIFGIAILRSTNSNLIPSYAVYAGWGGAVLVIVSTLGFDYGVLPEVAGFITLVLGGLVLYPLFIFGLGKAMETAPTK
jgi:hypothetical protein|tara:strand:- start:574 stop:1197 length:624 start_codon:yes stop_codon:yes gene_type:complete